MFYHMNPFYLLCLGRLSIHIQLPRRDFNSHNVCRQQLGELFEYPYIPVPPTKMSTKCQGIGFQCSHSKREALSDLQRNVINTYPVYTSNNLKITTRKNGVLRIKALGQCHPVSPDNGIVVRSCQHMYLYQRPAHDDFGHREGSL